ncbi:MAG: glycoside hydrolase family 2, partial [Kiritimatiellae bacterium]|nr:glycoside hydrolase family 2 [Kiritimatiellia bacterium]
MRRRMLSAVSLAAVLAAGGLYGRAGNVDLNGAWKLETFAQPDDGAVRALPLPKGLAVKSYPATVPGCCEMELVKAGELPDPMFSTNALAFMELEGNQWLYTKTFACPPRESGERAVLVFDGIDTLADVFFNGEKIGEADNMLIPHEFDVTDKIRVGAENTVQVLIRPVGLAARDKIPGELGWMMGGGANHEFFRKAPHMYGWDIMPHMPFSGIWRGVRLEVRPKCHIDYPAWIVRAIGVKHRWADVHVRMRITTPFSVFYKAKVRATLSRNGKVHSKEVPFRGPMCKLQVGLENVDFWWPRGMGEPALYDAKIELIADDGTVLAVDDRKIGIRQFAFEYDDIKLPERPGKFLFRVNGEPVFIRGVDWVPLDPIPSRQASHFEKVLPMMADLNCNLVRVWGGGVY